MGDVRAFWLTRRASGCQTLEFLLSELMEVANMYGFKLLGVLVGALFALGAMAASASAFTLPDVSIALGGTYPLHSEGLLPTAPWEIGGAGGSVLTGTGVSLLLLTTALSALGTFSSTLVKAKRSATEECHSVGDAQGVVLVGGEFHIVLGPGGTKQLLYILFLVQDIEIICEGGLENEVRGSVLGTFALNGEVETEEYETARGRLEGERGKQNFAEYFNDGGTIVKAKLEVESGGGFTASDENVAGEFILTTLNGQMFTVTGR
jgi:hypothetical protein